MAIDMRLELMQVPVSDIDRAKAFYVDQVGFNDDHDHQVSDEIRFVQLTPPGSACSIALTTGGHEMKPGSIEGVQLVIEDADAAATQTANNMKEGAKQAAKDVKEGAKQAVNNAADKAKDAVNK